MMGFHFNNIQQRFHQVFSRFRFVSNSKSHMILNFLSLLPQIPLIQYCACHSCAYFKEISMLRDSYFMWMFCQSVYHPEVYNILNLFSLSHISKIWKWPLTKNFSVGHYHDKMPQNFVDGISWISSHVIITARFL